MADCVGFEAIVPQYAKIMILGSMPSIVSLEEAFYYAHPRNAFWPIMAALLNRPYGSLASIEDKINACQQAGILLWDVLQSCERIGSLDSAIRNPQANDFESLFKHNSSITHVFFNGKAAQDLFKKYVVKQQNLPSHLLFYCLPSTSPAYAALSLEDKQLLWQEKISYLL